MWSVRTISSCWIVGVFGEVVWCTWCMLRVCGMGYIIAVYGEGGIISMVVNGRVFYDWHCSTAWKVVCDGLW